MMRCQALRGWMIGLLTAAVVASVASAWSQTNSTSGTTNSTSNSTTSTTGTNNGTTGSSTAGMAGVVIDANGVLHVNVVSDPGGQLMKERIASAKASLDPKVTAYSKLRKISLNRLEQAFGDRGGVLTDEMRYLAGLLRVRYVFYYPETKDIVLAGPAEGWAVDPTGRAVGIGSGRPVVQLQDLVVALRAFPSNGKGASLIGCSIDPTEQGLAAMQSFLRSIGSRATPDDTQTIVNGLRTSLGYQQVSINGISPKTHFAQVMVEADYRMKLIGIGLERPPVKLTSYVDRAKPTDISRNAMQRWYFVPDYQCVRVANDKLAMEMVGDGVKLVGEDEVVSTAGKRQSANRGNKASQQFVASFTKQYAELAERSPVYAELRNLVDLSIVAAYIHDEEYYAKADWKMEVFGDENAFALETYSVPQTVETAVNAIWKGHTLLTPVGGGVTIQPTEALGFDNLLSDEKGSVAKARESTSPNLPKGQWWWD